MTPSDDAALTDIGAQRATVPPPPWFASPTVLVGGAVAAILLVVVGVLSLLASGPTTSALIGQRFVAQSEPAVAGAGRVVWPWRAHHPAVLLFFGYWCPACHDELRTLGPGLGDGMLDGVDVVGIDSDASISVARSFVTANDIRFPVAHDWLPALTSKYVPADPATFFVSAKGQIVAVHYGVITLRELRAGVASLVGA
jgi:peroxiredoxin